MKHKIHHGLDRDLAIRATTKALEAYAKELEAWNPVVSWQGPNNAVVDCQVMGKSLQAQVDVGEDDVTFAMDVPFMMRPFQGQAISIVEKVVQDWIVKAKNGELDQA